MDIGGPAKELGEVLESLTAGRVSDETRKDSKTSGRAPKAARRSAKIARRASKAARSVVIPYVIVTYRATAAKWLKHNRARLSSDPFFFA